MAQQLLIQQLRTNPTRTELQAVEPLKHSAPTSHELNLKRALREEKRALKAVVAAHERTLKTLEEVTATRDALLVSLTELTRKVEAEKAREDYYKLAMGIY